MYEVKIINNKEETIINSVGASQYVPRITGSCKFGINTIDSFTFTIFPNNDGYNLIYPLKTLVEVKNLNTNNVEFEGRVLLQTPKMDSSGVIYKTVVCESYLGYLNDSVQNYETISGVSAEELFKKIINNHNSQVENSKKFIIGEIKIGTSSSDNEDRYLNYEKTFDSINKNLIERFGGELRVRKAGDNIYIDYIKEIGEKKNTVIALANNLIAIEQEKDPSEIITRLIPVGAKLENSDERLTITSINGGINYVEDEEAIKEFGVIVDTVNFDDITEAIELLNKAKSYLKENNKIKKKYKIDALDLSKIDLNFDSFEVGNTYRVINPLMNIDEELRIIEKTLDINSPQNSSLTFGDKFEDIKDYQLGITKATKDLNTLRYNVTAATENVLTINRNLQKTVDSLMTTNESLEKIKKRLIMGV